ncbi:MAG: hypothetical protein GY811_15980 [Myxococcales bacterium]|nr:hypothetical protein [Myxococcales bacterium]
MSYAIQITKSCGEQSIHRLDAAQTTIGSNPGMDICVSGEPGILEQHVLLAPKEDACWVSTSPGSPLWDNCGEAVDAGFVPWGSRLTLGRCVFELLRENSQEIASAQRNRRSTSSDTGGESTCSERQGIHPGMLMLLIATLAYAVLQGLTPASSDASVAPSQAPELFARAVPTCQGANPVHRAPLAEEQALAKGERMVFDLQDGVEAVGLFSEAQDCYRKAGLRREAGEVAEMGAALQLRILEEYDLLRLRLARDLSDDNWKSAGVQVRRLSELFRNQEDSSYALTLRRLSARLSRKGQNR